MSETPPTPSTGSPFSYRAPPPRRRPAWRTWAWIAVAIVVAIAVAMLMGSLAKNPTSGPGGGRAAAGRGGRGGGGGRVPTVVGVVTAVQGDIPLTLSALGTVTSEATVTVNTQIAGTLEKVNFKEGQIVRKGQLLAEVDTRPYVVALAQAEGQLARDQATLANARLDLTRYQTLKAQDSISGQQVDTQAATVKQDEGVVKSDNASVASARLNLTYCHIVAPVSGRVGLRQVDAGNYVTAGLANGLVIITQIDPIDVVFSLPEDNVPQVQARMNAGATLTVTALDRTGANSLATGALATLDNQIDTTTGTIKAKARFSNPGGTLFPNQFVNVQLLVDTLKNVVVVPTAAVRHGANGDYVFVLDQDPMTGANIGRMVNVKVGPGQGDRTSIASGVKVGDQLITDGGDRLTDGGTVLLPGQIPPSFGPRAQKPAGFFSWMASLFGHRPAADATAAGGAGGGAGGGHGGGAGRMQAMLDQLGLTPDQKARIDAIQAEQKTKMATAGDDPDARRAAMRDSFTKINAVLTPEQQAKMKALRDAARASNGGGAGGGGAAAGSAASGAPASSSAAAGLSSSPVAPPPDASAANSTPTPAPSTESGRHHGGGAAAGGPAVPGSGGPGGGRGGALTAILDDDQKAKAKAIMDDARASGDFSSVRAKIDAILRPDQKAKLAQMRAAREAAGGGAQ